MNFAELNHAAMALCIQLAESGKYNLPLPDEIKTWVFLIKTFNENINISLSCINYPNYYEILIFGDDDNICGYDRNVKTFNTFDELTTELDRIIFGVTLQ